MRITSYYRLLANKDEALKQSQDLLLDIKSLAKLQFDDPYTEFKVDIRLRKIETRHYE